MEFVIKIRIRGNAVAMSLCDPAGKAVSEVRWEDKRDFSEKFFSKIGSLLKRHKTSFGDIKRVDFDCDSPYFGKSGKKEIIMEDLDSTGRCGFTAWQTGETIARVLDFAIKTK